MEVVASFLSTLAAYVLEMDQEFKRRVCLDCGWSIPTFYRKIKPGQLLTPAEKQAIQNIAKQMAKQLTSHANQ